jgi:hypothetical protein
MVELFLENFALEHKVYYKIVFLDITIMKNHNSTIFLFSENQPLQISLPMARAIFLNIKKQQLVSKQNGLLSKKRHLKANKLLIIRNIPYNNQYNFNLKTARKEPRIHNLRHHKRHASDGRSSPTYTEEPDMSLSHFWILTYAVRAKRRLPLASS